MLVGWRCWVKPSCPIKSHTRSEFDSHKRALMFVISVDKPVKHSSIMEFASGHHRGRHFCPTKHCCTFEVCLSSDATKPVAGLLSPGSVIMVQIQCHMITRRDPPLKWIWRRWHVFVKSLLIYRQIPNLVVCKEHTTWYLENKGTEHHQNLVPNMVTFLEGPLWRL